LPLEHQEDWVLLRILAGEDPRDSPEFDRACPDWSAVLPRLWKRKWLGKPLTLTAIGRDRATELELLHPRGLPAPPGFSVRVAPMATGAAVNEDAGIFARLSHSMRKVLGVEMEASALGALGEALDVPVVVAKGVSDYGDPFKDDRFRDFAARAAAECLIALLRQAADLLPNVASGTPHGGGHSSGSTSQDASARTAAAPATSDLPLDLIHALAEEYPDVRDARALWARAGGSGSEVENVPRPRDMWQRLWLRSMQGASVRPAALLQAALADRPNNPVLLQNLRRLSLDVPGHAEGLND
jgi:hypothetical protein